MNLQCIKVNYASQLNWNPAFEVISWEIPVKTNVLNELSANYDCKWTCAMKHLQIG